MIAPTFSYNHFGCDFCRRLHPRAQVYLSRVDTPEGKVLSLLLICLNLCRSARAALSLFVRLPDIESHATQNAVFANLERHFFLPWTVFKQF